MKDASGKLMRFIFHALLLFFAHRWAKSRSNDAAWNKAASTYCVPSSRTIIVWPTESVIEDSSTRLFTIPWTVHKASVTVNHNQWLLGLPLPEDRVVSSIEFKVPQTRHNVITQSIFI